MMRLWQRLQFLLPSWERRAARARPDGAAIAMGLPADWILDRKVQSMLFGCDARPCRRFPARRAAPCAWMRIEELFSKGVMTMGPSRIDPSRQVGVFRPGAIAGLAVRREAEMAPFRWIAGE
ncbi:MAG TPA: hypothetical protein VMB03_09070 [Bryobacteraceae bacterium]|nr:hypothetical protein [Bryobacteraceae bacterium]